MADEIANLTLQILKQVQTDVSGLRGDVGELRAQLHSTRDELRGELHTEIGALRHEMGEFRAELRAELRAVANDSAARDAALDARISRLDAETTRGFQLVLSELRSHREFAVDTLRDHEQRIRRLEEQSSRGPER
jgi:hypothetical protein